MLLAFLHCFQRFHLQISVDEAVDVAVHDGVDVAHLVAGAGVLREGVGHEDVGADLGTPGDLQLVALDVLDLVEVLTLFDLDELGLQHAHTDFSVLVLGTLDLAADHDARGLVDESDGRGGLVDLLSAGAGRTVHFHLDVFRPQVDFDAVVDLGHDFDGREGCVTTSS